MRAFTLANEVPTVIESVPLAANSTLSELVVLYGATLEDVYPKTPGPTVGAKP